MTTARRPTLNLQILLIVFLVVAAVGQVAAGFLEERRQTLARARTAYLSALTATKVQLSGSTRRLMADQALKQNLAWNLSHSVSAAMSGKLQKGSLDEAWIIDENCAELGRAFVDHPTPFQCPFKEDGALPQAVLRGKSAFFWRMAGTHPALAVVQPFPATINIGQAKYAVGIVVLDDDWLQLYPGYRALAQDNGLSHLPDRLLLQGANTEANAATTTLTTLKGPTYSGTLLAGEGVAATGLPLAPLTSAGLFDNMLAGQLSADKPIKNPLLWPAILAGFAVSCLTFARDRQRERQLARREAGLAERCRELLTAPAVSCLEADAAPPPIGPASAALPAAAETLVLTAFRDKNKQLDLARARVEELNHEIAARAQDIERLSLRLAESAELDSLAMQMARTTEGFLAKADNLADAADKLSEALGGPIAEQSKILFNVLMEWQEGVSERGARKFIRGLSETPGSQPGQTLLDEQIMALAMMAGEISDRAVNSSVNSHRLVEGASSLARIAGLWLGLANVYGEDARAAGDATSLSGPLERALTLVRLDKRHVGLDFSARLNDQDLPELPPVRDGAWVTALYHVLLALADSAPGGQIGLRQRVEKDRVLLIAQLAPSIGASTALALPSQKSDRLPHHIEIARAVLAPFGISVQALPALDGPFPIALSWPLTAKQLSTATNISEGAEAKNQKTVAADQTVG